MRPFRLPTDSAKGHSSASTRTAEYIYFDELLLSERRNLARRWWSTFGVIYAITLLLVLFGWWQNGLDILDRPEAVEFVYSVLGIPPIAALAGFGIWLLWINRRPMRVWKTHFMDRPNAAFRVVLASVAAAGWTPWEIDYDHQVVVALSPEGMFEGAPAQLVTIYCSARQQRITEVRIQSRFLEATRLGDPLRVHQRNLKTFERQYRRFIKEQDTPNLPMPHPLARLKGRLPEEQELAVQAWGGPRARARLWALWIFISVIVGVILHLQPWFSPWVAWSLSFLAAGAFHFLLGNQWNAQEVYALSHATATVIANPHATRREIWEVVDQLAEAQRLVLNETLDENSRLYQEIQPALGYPGTYLLLTTQRNDAGVEQLIAVAVPEWGLLTALMPQVYAPFHLMAFMQSIRRGQPAPQAAALPSPDPATAV